MAVSISSANVVGSILTVGGTGFTSKPTAAPYRYRNWQGLTNGSQTDAEAQFDAIEIVNGGGLTFEVDNSNGVGSNGCLKEILLLTSNGDIFPHQEFSLPDVDYFKSSWFFRIDRQSNNFSSGTGQFKGGRAGKAVGGPVANYGTSNQYQVSWDSDHDGPTYILPYLNATMVDHGTTVVGPDFGTGNMPDVFNDSGVWHFVEYEEQNNTPGVNDGIFKFWIDGVIQLNVTNALMRDGSEGSVHFGFFQTNPGWTNALSYNDFVYYETHHCVDTTPAQIFLAQESTAAAVTQKFILPASTWTTTSIITDDADLAPTGYNYVYVMDTAGLINSSGFPLSSTPPTFSPAWASMANQ